MTLHLATGLAGPGQTPEGAGLNEHARRGTALLGDTTERDYSSKLRLFAAFAEPELKAAIQGFDLRPGMRVLDAGCGTGEALKWLEDEVAPDGAAVGLDLAQAHVAAASGHVAPTTLVLQADLLRAPFPSHSFDLIWCLNTINHLRDPVGGIAALATLTRPRGRVVLGQSSFLPDMYFAWDARLERVTNEAVRQYYRDRYGLNERDLTSVRSLVGWGRAAHLRDVNARTIVIERISPLRSADHAYVLEAIFRATWGQRLRQYMSPADYAELQALCDPDDPGFALRRPDFHLVQSLTLVTGVT
jgi:SAM-dependent methyltransferase